MPLPVHRDEGRACRRPWHLRPVALRVPRARQGAPPSPLHHFKSLINLSNLSAHPLTSVSFLASRDLTRTQVLDLLQDVTLGGGWSSQDLVTLTGWYYLYICEPTLYPLKHMKWGNKSNKAVLRMLGRIQKSGCNELKQQFPENPNAWSAADDAALDQQLQVRVRT